MTDYTAIFLRLVGTLPAEQQVLWRQVFAGLQSDMDSIDARLKSHESPSGVQSPDPL